MALKGWVIVVGGIVAATAGLAWFKTDQIMTAIAMGEAFPELHETVEPAIAAPVTWTPTTVAAGTVVSVQRADLRTEAAGTIREVGFAPGAAVTKGQVLIRLDTEIEEAELRAARAEAQLARANLDRARSLVKSRAGTEANLDRARADLEAAEAQIALIQARIDRRVVKAPFDGRTGLHNWAVGQYLEEGTNVTPLEGTSETLHVDFAVPQDAASLLREGSTVELLAPDGRVLAPATIVAANAGVTRTGRTLSFRAAAPAAGVGLRPGAYVDVRAAIGAPLTAVSVPLTAVRRAPYGDHVFRIVEKDGQLRAAQALVKTGPIEGDRILILSGLAVGDRIAGVGAFKLRDGLLVKTSAPMPQPEPGAAPVPQVSAR